jgi:hypothetical protein
MVARRGLAVALVLACAVLSPGCATSPYQLDASSAALLIGPRVTRTTRPTRCPADAQPAVVGLHDPDRTPVWGCLLACPTPKQEYVTNVTRVEDGWYLSPACQFMCGANEHRTSYLDFEHQAHCAAGAVTDPEQLATLAREVRFQKDEQAEQDRRMEILARKKADVDAREAEGRRRQYLAHLDALEDEVRAMATTPVPWPFELVQEHVAFPQELEAVRGGLHLDTALRDALNERVAALLPKREKSEAILGVERPGGEPATDRLMRIRSCQTHCDDEAFPWSCAQLAPGTCASCVQAQAQCRATCTATTR